MFTYLLIGLAPGFRVAVVLAFVNHIMINIKLLNSSTFFIFIFPFRFFFLFFFFSQLGC